MGARYSAAHRLLIGAIVLMQAAGLMSGCAVNPAVELADLTRHRDALWVEAPFFPQTEFQCGPAALAGVLNASGAETTPEGLRAQVYLPKRQGSLQVELLAATRRAGRIPYLLEGGPEMLVQHVEAGWPVLLLQNLRTPGFPAWHYAVLVGVDPARNLVYLNSGEQQRLPVKAPEFVRTWEWGSRWAMVALRPGEIPAGSDPERFLMAVADFESVAGVAAAVPAWRAANLRWPEDPRPYLALGNIAYGKGDLQAAIVQYRLGLKGESLYPALINNLASVMGEAGCPREAEQVLLHAMESVEYLAPWDKILISTRAELSGRNQLSACNESLY